jgi:hypothetical protein
MLRELLGLEPDDYDGDGDEFGNEPGSVGNSFDDGGSFSSSLSPYPEDDGGRRGGGGGRRGGSGGDDDGGELPEDCNLFAKDKKGRTALDWARLGKHRQCAELLERKFVEDIERQRLAKERADERVRLQGMISRNATARKALLECIDEARSGDMHLLLASTEKIRDGVPPLTRETYAKAIRLLLPTKAARKKEIFWLDVESMVNGTVVVMACTCGDLPLLRKLVEPRHGIKLDRETQRGHTALTW